MKRACLAALAVVSAAGVARADAPGASPPAGEPDPAVEEASDANLESAASRTGIVVSGSLGGGMIIGIGVDDSAGRGPAVSLRLGHVATPHTVITFGVDFTLALHKPKDFPVQTNSDTNLLAGAQYYVNPSLWLRFAGGLGVYQGRKVLVEVDNMQTVGDLTLIGPAALAGIGVDIVRFKWAVLGLEAATSATVNRQGVLLASHLNLGLSFD
jgi:hypothetical protein